MTNTQVVNTPYNEPNNEDVKKDIRMFEKTNVNCKLLKNYYPKIKLEGSLDKEGKLKE